MDDDRSVLNLLRNTVITLKVKMCDFFTISFIYLDHDTRPRCLEIGSYRSEDIRELNRPTTVTELNSFFGLYIVLRRFVQNLASIAVHLNKICRKPTIKIWTAESRRDREYESPSKRPNHAAGSSPTAPYRKIYVGYRR